MGEFNGEGLQGLGEDVDDFDGGADHFGPYSVGGDRGDAVVGDGRHVGGRSWLGFGLT